MVAFHQVGQAQSPVCGRSSVAVSRQETFAAGGSWLSLRRTLGKEHLKRLDTWLSLIKDAASLEVVGEFLRQHEAASSAQSWQSMFDDRVLPALEAGLVQEADLWELLDETEEHGRQHVFLYQGNAEPVAHCLNEKRIRKWAETNDIPIDKRESRSCRSSQPSAVSGSEEEGQACRC